MNWRRGIIFVAACALLAAAASALWWWSRDQGVCHSCVEYTMSDAQEMPTAIAVADDGAAWFSLDSGRSIGLLRDGKIERIDLGRRVQEAIGLDVDREGNAWMANAPTVSVLRIKRTGEVSETALGTPIGRMARLAVAADDSVWFAEASAFSFSRIKDGVLKRHVISAARGGPYGVAVSADGTAWGTLQSGNKLVRISPSSEISEIELPTRAAAPTDVAVAPDGAVWLLEFRSNKVARYADGKFTEFDIAGEFAGLSGLAVAADGSVWFGLLRRGALGCLKNGKFSSLRLPREDARPYTLTADRTGSIWYADISGVVGKVPAASVAAR